MKDKLIMIAIPLCCIVLLFACLFWIDQDLTSHSTSILTVTTCLFITLASLSLIYSLYMWYKYDKDIIYLLCLWSLNIIIIPFYYIRIKNIINKQNGRQKLSPAYNKMVINNLIIKIMLVLSWACAIYYVLPVLFTLFYRNYVDDILTIYYPVTILSTLLWIYLIYCWHIVDNKSKYLFLLVLFNVFYVPFYLLRILKIIKFKQID